MQQVKEMGSLMLGMCRPIFGLGKSVVLDSAICVDKGITDLEEKSVYVVDMIKKRRYWQKGVPGDPIFYTLLR